MASTRFWQEIPWRQSNEGFVRLFLRCEHVSRELKVRQLGAAPAGTQQRLRLGGHPNSCQPVSAKDDSPAIYRWVSAETRTSPARDERTGVSPNVFFRPSGALGLWGAIVPAMNRWAIVGRPCGTFARRRRSATTLVVVAATIEGTLPYKS